MSTTMHYLSLAGRETLTEELIRLCMLAAQLNGAPTEDAIQGYSLCKVSKHIKDLGDLMQKCVRLSKRTGHGLYHHGRELQECHNMKGECRGERPIVRIIATSFLQRLIWNWRRAASAFGHAYCITPSMVDVKMQCDLAQVKMFIFRTKVIIDCLR